MTTVNQTILDGSIRHMVWLERYKTNTVHKLIAMLNKADKDLIRQIAARMATIEVRGFDLGPETTKRLREMRADIQSQRESLYASIQGKAADELQDFAIYEAGFQASLIEKSMAGLGTIDLNRPALSQLKAAVTSQPFQGRLLKEWFSSLAQDDARRINDAVRMGIVEGQTTDQIVRRIRGTKRLGYAGGLLEISRRHTQTVVRTAVAHVSDRAGQSVWEANTDIIKGLKWVSTLDGRTSSTCRARDGQIYPVKSAPPIPAHHGCRSRKVPYLGETSIKGTRASSIGSVPADTTYESWLKKQPAKTQNEILGVSKAKLFREGGLPLERFTDPMGKSYTLQQLRDRDREIFDDVFGGAPARNQLQRTAQEAEFKEYMGSVTYDRMKQGVKKAMSESGVSSYGMSEAELVAIHAYTHGDKYFERLNTALRSNNAEAIARVAPMANILDNAMEKLPAYKGAALFRVTELPADVVPGIKTGGAYSDPAFMSASKADLGKSFGDEYRFTIVRSTQGKEIAGFSAYAHEQEVLFPRGTKFDIIKAWDNDETGFVEVILNDQTN